MRYRLSLVARVALLALVGCSGPSHPGANQDGGNGDASTKNDGSVVVAAPDEIVWGVQETGSVSAGHAVDLFVDVPSDGVYVWAFDPTSSTAAEFRLYSDAARTQLITYCSSYYVDACTFDLTAGRTYVQVTTPLDVTQSYSFLPLRLVNEGSAAAPVPISSPSGWHTAAAYGSSYFVYDAATSGAYDFQPLEVSFSNKLGYFRLTFFANADFSSTPIGSCGSSYSSPTVCDVDGLPSGPIGVRVDETDGRPVGFSMTPIHTLGEGARSQLVPLTVDVPLAGSVDDWSRSFYGLTTGASATSYTFALSGLVSSYPILSVYAPGAATPVKSCNAAACTVSGLDPATTYEVRVESGSDEHYSLLATKGSAEGSPAYPVVLTDSVQHSITAEASALSYYTFTPTHSGYYSADITETPIDATASFKIFSSFSAPSPLVNCSLYTTPATCDLGPLDAGVTYAIVVGNGGTASTVAFTISNPLGEGTPTSPIVVTPNVTHTGTFESGYGYYPNYYEFTTDADGGSYGVAFGAAGTVSAYSQSGASYAPTCYAPTSGGPQGTTCFFSNLPPSSTFVFSATLTGVASDRSLSLLVLDLDAIEPCEPGASACYTFEDNLIPAAFTDVSAPSAKPWAVSAAAANHGTYGFAGGISGSSCFELTTPIGTQAIAFGLDAYSSAPSGSDSLSIMVDGGPFPILTIRGDAAGYRRSFLALYPASTHVVQFCVASSSLTTHHTYVDDFAVR